MQFNVSQLLKEVTGSSRSYPLQANYADAGRFAESVVGEVNLVRTHQGVLVRATVDVRVRLICGRCLTEFTANSDMMLEEEYFPQIDVNSGQRLPLPEDEEGLPIGTDHLLDLTEALRQAVITTQPMKPLCREGCRGLCQECGGRLDEEVCNCGGVQRDPRWGVLTAMLADAKE